MNTDANTDFAEEPDQEEPLDGEEEPEETPPGWAGSMSLDLGDDFEDEDDVDE